MKDAAKISDGDILDVLLSEEKEYDITIKSMIKYMQSSNQSMDSTTPNLRRGKKVCSTRGSFFFKLYLCHIAYRLQPARATKYQSELNMFKHF